MIAANEHPLTFQRGAIPDILIVPGPVPARLACTGLQHCIAALPGFLKITTSYVIVPGISCSCLNVLAHTSNRLKQIISMMDIWVCLKQLCIPAHHFHAEVSKLLYVLRRASMMRLNTS